MEAKSIERIAEELGVNFYDLYPLISARDEFHRRVGIREVVKWIELGKFHIDGFPCYDAQAWQAKLKEWDV